MTRGDRDGAPRLRRARALVVAWDARGPVGRNWFMRTECVLDGRALALLETLGSWCSIDSCSGEHADEHELAALAEGRSEIGFDPDIYGILQSHLRKRRGSVMELRVGQPEEELQAAE